MAPPLLFEELRGLAGSLFRRERPETQVQPPAFVHEAYLRLGHAEILAFDDRSHFLAVAARVMRQVMVDYWRTRTRHGGF